VNVQLPAPLTANSEIRMALAGTLSPAGLILPSQ
jgi:hypothetical protein